MNFGCFRQKLVGEEKLLGRNKELILSVWVVRWNKQNIECYYFVQRPTDAQLYHKLSHCYMFRHYRVILRQPAINTLPSYTSISNAAVGNKFTIKMFHTGFMQTVNCVTDSCI